MGSIFNNDTYVKKAPMKEEPLSFCKPRAKRVSKRDCPDLWRLELASVRHKSECPSRRACGWKSSVKPKTYEQRVVYSLHYVGRKFAYFFFDSAFVYRANLLQ